METPTVKRVADEQCPAQEMDIAPIRIQRLSVCSDDLMHCHNLDEAQELYQGLDEKGYHQSLPQMDRLTDEDRPAFIIPKRLDQGPTGNSGSLRRTSSRLLELDLPFLFARPKALTATRPAGSLLCKRQVRVE